MLKYASSLLLCLCTLFLAACSIPSNPPATVTDPALRSLYMEAVAGDGEALYRVSRLYGAGINGFPKSSWYSSIALNDAAYHNQPQAVYELAVMDLHHLRDRLTSSHARNDSYKNWAELEDKLVAVRREVARAGTLGDARAANTLAAIDEDMVRYHQLTRRERHHYAKCPHCNGEGKSWEYERPHGPNVPHGHGPAVRDGHRDDHHRHDERRYVECPSCHGNGFVNR